MASPKSAHELDCAESWRKTALCFLVVRSSDLLIILRALGSQGATVPPRPAQVTGKRTKQSPTQRVSACTRALCSELGAVVAGGGGGGSGGGGGGAALCEFAAQRVEALLHGGEQLGTYREI